jgi:hypothetical protein
MWKLRHSGLFFVQTGHHLSTYGGLLLSHSCPPTKYGVIGMRYACGMRYAYDMRMLLRREQEKQRSVLMLAVHVATVDIGLCVDSNTYLHLIVREGGDL